MAGEEPAWRELYGTYHPVALRFLLRSGVDSADVADAAQEVFVQVYRALPAFEGRAEFKTWLYRLCITQASRHHRKAKVQRALRLLVYGWHSDPAPGADAEAATMVAQAIRRLKPHTRDAFVLFELEGLSGQDIAKVLGCPVATVWRRVHEARRQFEEHMALQERKRDKP